MRGASAREPPVICAVCNATLPEESRYCLSCGADMSDPGAERRPFDTVAEIQDLLTGVVAGHYKVGKLLGRGGMGTVFLAEDLTLQREVAIKVLPPRLTSEPKFVARFVQEARNAAKLDHPNIIPIYAVQSANDLHYFAMKYVTGRTIEGLLESGPLPVDECRRILADAASALAHAHHRGVVHRDVKPSNIMIDDSGRVLLTDFGISKALESSTAFTGTGQLVGTPHYMSPEQAKGSKVDGRTDQYSLAVVGYQMLTGQLLFPSGPAHTIIYGHIHETPTTPRVLRPDVPEYLAQALLKALSKDPDQRFATMTEFAAAVQPERATEFGGFVSGPGHTPIPSVVARRTRQRVLIGATAIVAASVVGIALYRSGQFAPPAPLTAPPALVVPAPGVTANTADSVAGRAPATSPQQSAVPPARAAETAKIPPPTPPRAAPVVAPPAAQQPSAAVGWLTVAAEPYGTLSVGGVEVGDTPVVRHALAPGSYAVRVVRDGYKPWSETIVITAGNTVPRRILLEPLP
jgi:serine/threonine-protein kinase